jgi:hypothetical protein
LKACRLKIEKEMAVVARPQFRRPERWHRPANLVKVTKMGISSDASLPG